MNNTTVYRLPNVLFGLLIGLSFIVTSAAFLLSGQGIIPTPQLQNIYVLLSIAGTFIGVRKYREEALNGTISYGRALKAALFMVGTGACLYGIYVYVLYGAKPELTAQYLEMTEAIIQQTYANSPLKDTVSDLMKGMVSPGFIAMSEILNKIFTGFIFSLFLAGILRKTTPAQQL